MPDTEFVRRKGGIVVLNNWVALYEATPTVCIIRIIL